MTRDRLIEILQDFDADLEVRIELESRGFDSIGDVYLDEAHGCIFIAPADAEEDE